MPRTCCMRPARYASRSSIRTSPARGAASRASSISVVSKSESSRSSSRSKSSSSSSQSRALRTRHFSRRPIFRQALLRVITTSLSISACSISASSAASIAASNSAPGFSPVSRPMRRCWAARADCSRIIEDRPSLMIFRRSSLSRSSGLFSERRRDSHNSTATKSGSNSLI